MFQSRFNKILVPLDGSKNAFRALSHACDLAESFNATIELLYVLLLSKEIPSYTHNVTIPDSVITNAQEFGQNILKEGLQQIPPSIHVTYSIEIGLPPEKIVEISQNNKTDLIVMGSRGLGVIKGILVGSVSNYVVHHAQCPVMVVK